MMIFFILLIWLIHIYLMLVKVVDLVDTYLSDVGWYCWSGWYIYIWCWLMLLIWLIHIYLILVDVVDLVDTYLSDVGWCCWSGPETWWISIPVYSRSLIRRWEHPVNISNRNRTFIYCDIYHFQDWFTGLGVPKWGSFMIIVIIIIINEERENKFFGLTIFLVAVPHSCLLRTI